MQALLAPDLHSGSALPAGAGGSGLGGLLQWLSGGGPAPGSPAASPAATPPPAVATFLLLACDGVWDVLSNEEACEFIAREVVSAAGAAGEARAEGEEAAVAVAAAYLGGTAERLRALVLERTARVEGVPARMLLSLRPGKGGRRDVHDDITAVICFVGGLQGVARFAAQASAQEQRLQ